MHKKCLSHIVVLAFLLVAVAFPSFAATTLSPVYPSDGEEGVSKNMTLRWRTNGDTFSGDVAATYEVLLGKSAGTMEIIALGTNIQIADPLRQLDANTTYYWQVKAYFGTTIAAIGDVWAFRTGSGSVIEAVYPSPGTEDVENDTPLEWTYTLPDGTQNPSGTTYTVWIGEGLDEADANPRTTTKTILDPPLRKGKRYFWRVRAVRGNETVYSPYWTFKTVTDKPGDEGSFTALAPTPGAENVNPDAVFQWEYTDPYGTKNPSGAVYTIYIGTNIEEAERSGVRTTSTLYPKRLASNTRYFWKIRAETNTGAETSEFWTFRTEKYDGEETTTGGCTVGTIGGGEPHVLLGLIGLLSPLGCLFLLSKRNHR